MSNFLDMRPGDVREFENMKPKSVVKAFSQAFSGAGIPEAKCDFWTYPGGRAADQTVQRIWLARCDGLSEGELEAVRSGSLQQHREQVADFAGVRTFLIDGRAICEETPLNPKRMQRARVTKYGWEFMKVGDSKTVRLSTRDLKQVIATAIVNRRLEWVFRCDREIEMERDMAEEDGKHFLSCWTVTRTA